MSLMAIVLWLATMQQPATVTFSGDTNTVAVWNVDKCDNEMRREFPVSCWYLDIKNAKPPEPVDVPAVQETIPNERAVECFNHYEGCTVESDTGKIRSPDVWLEGDADIRRHLHLKRWTCTDRARILLTAEDGTRHCLKFNQQTKPGGN